MKKNEKEVKEEGSFKIKKKPSKVRKAKAGGPVVKRYGGGKVIKSNRSGNDLVASCYD